MYFFGPKSRASCLAGFLLLAAGCSEKPEPQAAHHIQPVILAQSHIFVLERSSLDGRIAESSANGAYYNSRAQCEAALTGIYIQFLKQRAFYLEQRGRYLTATNDYEFWRCVRG